MSLLRLALLSLGNRRLTALLVVITIAAGVVLLLGVEKVRSGARTSFINTISGTDLVVGARSGSIQLLLYSVFRIGNATSNISWDSYEEIASRPEVAWSIPMSLGDSHRGYRVLGTNHHYFEHYRYGAKRSLSFIAGGPFEDVFDAVLGAEVAAQLDYGVDKEIVLAHGLGSAGIAKHDDKPFRVVGVLGRTGTAIDRTIHVSLQGIEAMHVDWKQGVRVPGREISAERAREIDLTPRAITAFLVGLNQRLDVFRLQRDINTYTGEPLLAILPGVALQELWDLVRVAEQALLIISLGVVFGALVSLMAVMLAGMNERRREISILRAVGARHGHLVILLTSEAAFLTLAGIVLGGVVYSCALIALGPWIESEYGLYLALTAPEPRVWALLAAVLAAGTLMGLVPAWRAYRHALVDGLSARV